MNSAVIIGSGNVATNFALAFQQAGIKIISVYSKTFANAQLLAGILKTQAISTVNEIPKQADIYFLAIKDSLIQEVSDSLNVNGTVVHCAGSTSMDLLSNHKSFGVIWPVQTISKNIFPDFKTMPLCVEGSDEKTTEKLFELSKKISGHVILMNSEQRKFAHLAAVLSNNFSNHLFDIGSQILEQHGMSFDLLRPIVIEVARKLQLAKPNETQTGPAKRNDTETIKMHLEMLNENPRFKEIYRLLSESIIEQNKHSH